MHKVGAADIAASISILRPNDAINPTVSPPTWRPSSTCRALRWRMRWTPLPEDRARPVLRQRM